MIDPPKRTIIDIRVDAAIATEGFRTQRILEPLEDYLRVFDEYRGVIESLLAETVDLTDLRRRAASVLGESKTQEVIRYLMGPPISADDLKILTEATSLNTTRLNADPILPGRVIQVILDGLDRRRFVWVSEGREATDAEKQAAVIASAALIATRRLETSRRNEGKKRQEEQVSQALLSIGFTKAPARTITAIHQSPKPGEFCSEAMFSGRKADFVIGLYDNRIMPLECKVSNSSTNSVKRLNNDAAVKAEIWKKDFGTKHVVPAAVLSGVFKDHNVLSAQERGLKPEKVWRALTEPALVEQWLMPNDIRPEIGHHFTFQAPAVDGWDGTVHCEVLEVIPLQLLVYTWTGGSKRLDGHGHELDTVVTWRLEPTDDGGTPLTLVHSGFDANSYAFKAMSQGWRGKAAERISQVL